MDIEQLLRTCKFCGELTLSETEFVIYGGHEDCQADEWRRLRSPSAFSIRSKLVVSLPTGEPEDKEPEDKEPEDLDGVDYAKRTLPKLSRKEQLRKRPTRALGIGGAG